MNRLSITIAILMLSKLVWAQPKSVTRYTYHDAEHRFLKEAYEVRDTVKNVLNGRYASYFLNGKIESKGQFINNETSGIWEFYYENGNLKMRGMLKQNSNQGLWEYFYENGRKSMEGNIENRLKEGIWKIYYESGELKETGEFINDKRNGLWITFFEDGIKRGEINYEEDHGRFTEYYHSGKVYAEGPRKGSRQVGLWRYFDESGVLQRQGEFANGKRHGEWIDYYPNGKISATGNYENDEQSGEWRYYFEDGSLSSIGQYVGGKKSGYWSSNFTNGKIKSEGTYNSGSGDYREYYESGKLKVKGTMRNGKQQGGWKYYSEDGTLEAECDYDNGKGKYLGYFPSGALQTRGEVENELRVGTWELFEEDGNLVGYYKPVQGEDQLLTKEINSLVLKKLNAEKSTSTLSSPRKRFTYFESRYREYRGVILQGNPAFTFVGVLPLGIEFYNEERLGHEFSFEAIRNPFFTPDRDVPLNEVFQRGYAIAMKQKFYNPLKLGMWYFAHELRFTNVSHFTNVMLPSLPGNFITVNASEQRADYGLLLGSRLMKSNRGDGLTLDGFVGYSFGYRFFDVDENFDYAFDHIAQKPLAQTFRFGFTIGYSLSFDGRR